MQSIHFYKEEDTKGSEIPETEYFIEPDMVIAANGIGPPRKKLASLVGAQETGSEARVQIGSNPNFIPHVNTRF